MATRAELGWAPYQRGVQQKVGSFTREVSFSPGHPNTKNYGVGTMGVNFVLHGAQGSIEFSWNTGIIPEKVDRIVNPRTEWDLTRIDPFAGIFGPLNLDPYTVVEWNHSAPQGTRVSYHSAVSQYESQESGECNYLEGGRCFSDASYLSSDDIFTTLMERGEGATWEEIEKNYAEYYQVPNA